jgi:hypothetical protein
MKTNKYADLIKFGLSQKTLMSLTESSINVLHKNLIEGKKDICPKCGMKNCKCNHSKKKETKETVTTQTLPPQKVTKITPDTAKSTGANVGNVDVSMDSSGNIIAKGPLNTDKGESKKGKVIKDGEMSESKTKKNKYDKINPWRICHSQVGPKKTPKFERCVRAVKQSIGEGKNPFSVLLEEKILSLLETHLRPKMTKGELMDLLGKKTMKTPIGRLNSIGGSVSENTKEKEAPVRNPGTKTPSKPKTKDPFKPEPHKQPKPKAHHKKHETKEFVMDAPAPTKEPKVTPGTKTPPKPKTKDPFRPEPHKQPNPKARKKLPSWLTFKNLGIKLKK